MATNKQLLDSIIQLANEVRRELPEHELDADDTAIHGELVEIDAVLINMTEAIENGEY